MASFVKALYRNGVFVPTSACDLPEHAEVQVWFHDPYIIPPTVTDPEEKRREFAAKFVENDAEESDPDRCAAVYSRATARTPLKALLDGR